MWEPVEPLYKHTPPWPLLLDPTVQRGAGSWLLAPGSAHTGSYDAAGLGSFCQSCDRAFPAKQNVEGDFKAEMSQ